MSEALKRLIETLETAPETAVGAIDVLPETERRLLIEEWNSTQSRYPSEQPIHQLFEQQADSTPEAVAVEDEVYRLTYRELNARANRLARHLLNLGIEPDSRVAICLERSIDLVVSQLAVLKCGAAYVPIDPAFPSERQLLICADCSARAVITSSRTSLPPALASRRVMIDQLDTDEGFRTNLSLPLHSTMTAYVMYTSGSTGQPKGVAVPHRAVSRLVLNCRYAEFQADDRVAFAANPAFDASTMEVWAPLLNGGRIIVIDQDRLLVPADFSETLRRQEVSVLWLTAGLFNQYAERLSETFGRLRYLIVGGEALDPRTISGALDRHRPQHLLNGYGPTETTTFAITHEITEVPEDACNIPLGRPIGNTRVFILDANHRPAPIGATGEIHIGGDGVAHGYLDRPELNAERFLPDPIGPE
jgi:amino acid adenylation domain-containing protein